MTLVTNTNKENDRMFKRLRDQSHETDVSIAVAFFSHFEMLEYMVENDCNVFLVVRLGIGTNPDSLIKALSLRNVDIRFFTGNSFHPKVYVFGNRKAYVGSSNFTRSGLQTNQEMIIEVDGEEPIFDEIVSVFGDYWNEAEPLTANHACIFAEICQQGRSYDPHQTIGRRIGQFEFNNVGREKQTGDRHSTFVSAFRRRYQTYISRFRSLQSIYTNTGLRRYADLPFRIEIDRFLWWIREYKATGDSYQIGLIRGGEVLVDFVAPLITEFADDRVPYLEEYAIPRYKAIAGVFASRDNIESMDVETLYETLLNVYAFHDRFRFFEGGHSKMKAVFLEQNPEGKIKYSISHLLHGADDYETRISDCVLNPAFKLQGFGEGCVKELYGLVNQNDIPICNGRTLKSMEWLGFGRL